MAIEKLFGVQASGIFFFFFFTPISRMRETRNVV